MKDFVVSIHDLSGFSTLSNKWRDSADLVADTINAVFSELIDLIAKHGGDVINFAGDALIVSWTKTVPGEEASLWKVVSQALKCSYEVR